MSGRRAAHGGGSDAGHVSVRARVPSHERLTQAES
jgi:hypothetical protein